MTKIELLNQDNLTRNAVVELTRELEAKIRQRFDISALVPSIQTKSELDIVLRDDVDKRFLSGIVIPTVLSEKILFNRRLKAMQTNLMGTSADRMYEQMNSKLIIFDNTTEYVYYRNGWPIFKQFVEEIKGIDRFVSLIDASFNDSRRGADPGTQSRAWTYLSNNEALRIEFIKHFFKAQSMHRSFYLSCPSQMLHREVDNCVENAAALNKSAAVLAGAYGKPFQLTININDTALKSSRFMKEFYKAVMVENLFGSDFESICFKFPNEQIHSSSTERKNFSAILDMIGKLKEQNKTAMILNSDPALALVSVNRGVDVVGVPLSGNTRIMITSEKAPGFIRQGNFFNPFNLENLGFEDFNEIFEMNNRIPFHRCVGCDNLENKNLKKMSTIEYNIYRKVHMLCCLTELTKQIRDAVERKELGVGTWDRISRSNYKNYVELVRNNHGGNVVI